MIREDCVSEIQPIRSSSYNQRQRDLSPADLNHNELDESLSILSPPISMDRLEV